MTHSNDLGGQVALVTGGGRGIGATTCEMLAASGADIVVVDQDPDVARETAHRVEALGRRALALSADVAKEGDVETAFHQLLERFGRLDILVNNAGVGGKSTVEAMPSEEWRRIVAINLDGAFYCSRAAVRLMKPRGYGRIVNVSSIVAVTFSIVSGAGYTASKAGMLGLTRQLAMEVAQHGITVNAIMPALVVTPKFHGETTATQREELVKLMPIGRLIPPQEVAALIGYLASPIAGSIVGQAIAIDGGLSITAGWYKADAYA